MAEQKDKKKHNRFRKNVAAPIVAAIMTTNAVAPAVAANTSEAASLEAELEKARLHDAKQMKTGRATDFNEAKRNFERANQDVLHHSEALKRSEKALKELEDEHREAVSKKEASEQILQNLPNETNNEIRKSIKNNEGLIIEVEEEIKGLEKSIEREKSNIAEYETRLAKADIDRKTTAMKLENLLAEISAENPDFEKDYEELLKPVTKLREEIEQYGNAVAVSEQEIDTLENQLAEINQVLSETETKKADLEIRSKTLTEEILEGEKRVAELEIQYKEAFEGIKGNEEAAKADYEETKRLYNQAKEQVDAAAIGVSETENNHRYTLDRLADAEIKLKTEQKNYGEKNAAYKEQKDKTDKAKAEYDARERTVTLLNREKNSKKAEYERLGDQRIVADDALIQARRQCNVCNANANNAECDVKDAEEELNNFSVPGFTSNTGSRDDAVIKLENAKNKLIEQRELAAEARRICDEKMAEYQGIDMNWRSLQQGVLDKTAEYNRSVTALNEAEQNLKTEKEKLLKIQAISTADKTKLEEALKEKEKASKVCDKALEDKTLAEERLKKAEEAEVNMASKLDEARNLYEEAKKASGETRLKTTILSRTLKPAPHQERNSHTDFKEIKKALSVEKNALSVKKEQEKELKTEQMEIEASLLDLENEKKQLSEKVEEKKEHVKTVNEILEEKKLSYMEADEKIKEIADDYKELEEARMESERSEKEYNRISADLESAKEGINKKEKLKIEKQRMVKSLVVKQQLLNKVTVEDVRSGNIDYSLLPEFERLSNEFKTTEADIENGKNNIISLSLELNKKEEETAKIRTRLAEAKTEQAIHEKVYKDFCDETKVTEEDKKAPSDNGNEEGKIPEKDINPVAGRSSEGKEAISLDKMASKVETGDNAMEKLLESAAAGSAALLVGSKLLKKKRDDEENDN